MTVGILRPVDANLRAQGFFSDPTGDAATPTRNRWLSELYFGSAARLPSAAGSTANCQQHVVDSH